MEVLKIDGRTKKVFVLDRSDTRIVYIPVLACHRVDYDRLRKAEAEKPSTTALLHYLRKVKFDNGRNALDVLDKLIQVADISGDQAARLAKPDEPESFSLGKEAGADDEPESAPAKSNQSVQVNESNSGVDESKINPEDPNEPVEGVSYMYKDAKGKTKVWEGKGRMPNAIKDALADGKQLFNFAI